MGDQTENNKDTKSTDDKKKKKKPKGPIRTEAVIPFVIFIGLLSVYYALFFDSNLKSALELAGSYGYGAEVNIAKLETSIRKAFVNIEGLEITDIDKVEENIFAVEKLTLALNMDALLRAKLVINNAEIGNIRLHAKRKNPGKIFHLKDKLKDSLGDSKEQLLGNAQKKFAGNVFGDAAALLDGGDPLKQLGDINSGLETNKRINEIRESLKARQTQWDEKFKELPNKEAYSQLNNRIKALKFNSKNPAQLAKDVKEAGKIIKESEKNVSNVKTAGKNLNSDINGLQKDIKSLEQSQKDDLAALGKRMKLPKLDAKNIAFILFGDQVLKYTNGVEKYTTLARKYLPEKDDSAEAKTQPKARASGKNYEFVTEKSYPLFWLKQAKISSKADKGSGSFNGNLDGLLTNFTSNPRHLGKPAIISIKGDFPAENIRGINAEVVIDHTSETPQETINATIGHFPVEKKEFSKSEKVQFGFKQATGSTKISGRLQDSKINLKINTKIRNIAYYVSAKSKGLQQALEQVTRDVPVITIGTQIDGQWQSPGVRLSTNLAKAIQNSLNRQLKAKIKAAKAKLKKRIDALVKGNKDKLNKEFASMKAQYQGKIDKLKGQADKSKKSAQAKIDKAKKSGKAQKVEKKAKKEVDKLRKKFKF